MAVKKSEIHPAFTRLHRNNIDEYFFVGYQINQEILAWEAEYAMISALEPDCIFNIKDVWAQTIKLNNWLQYNFLQKKALLDTFKVSKEQCIATLLVIIKERIRELRTDNNMLLLYRNLRNFDAYLPAHLVLLIQYEFHYSLPKKLQNIIDSKKRIAREYYREFCFDEEYYVGKLEQIKQELEEMRGELIRRGYDLCIEPGLIGIHGIQEQVKIIDKTREKKKS